MSKSPTGSLFERVFHRETDHGGWSMGDALVLILDAVLLVYSGYWSWHFMQAPLPESDKVLALVGLWGLDVGAVFWSLVWIFGSTTRGQDAVSMVMWIIDLLGMTVTSFVGFIGLSPVAGQSDISRWVVSAIIMLNIVTGFVYHMTSPQTAAARKQRKMRAEMSQTERDAAIQIEREGMELTQSERMLEQRKALIEREKELTRQQLELEGIKRGLQDARDNSTKLTGDIAGKTRKEVESAARQGAPEQVDINNGETTESEPPATAPEPSKLEQLREAIGRVVPHGQGGNGTGNGSTDPNA